MDERYREQSWPQKYPDLPFATLVSIAATYCYPEVYDEAYPELIERVRAARPDDERMRVFKDELRRALSGEWYPAKTLDHQVDFHEGGPEVLLPKLWRDLYPDEPLPAPPEHADG